MISKALNVIVVVRVAYALPYFLCSNRAGGIYLCNGIHRRDRLSYSPFAQLTSSRLHVGYGVLLISGCQQLH